MSALAPITAAVGDLLAAQQTETATLESLVVALKALAGQTTVDPAQVASIAAQIETSVAALKQANTDGQAALAPPAAPAA